MIESQLFSLASQSALVVGAASGIGRAGALGLADFGAFVFCGDLHPQGAEDTANEIIARGGRAASFPIDIRDQRSVDAALERVGAPDILVTTPSINVRKPLVDVTDAEFDQVVDVNLKGTFRLLRGFGPKMAERGSGSIIAFSSIRAQVVEPGQGVYAATKAATLQMLRGLASELGPNGVRVNAIAPGVVETPLTAQIKEQPEWYEAYAQKTILNRWASPDEMVGAIIFLASGASSYVTGHCLVVDGGWTAIDGRYNPPL